MSTLLFFLVLSIVYQGCMAGLFKDLVYANKYEHELFVGPNAKYKTVQSAIDAVPENNADRYTINLAPGVYREKVTVPGGKNFISLVGSEDKKFATVIVFNGSTKDFNSSTVAIDADFFLAQYITFKNDAPENPGAKNVALRVSGGYAAFYDCFITSNQDTLYDHTGEHFYKRTYIQGKNFIFGQALSLFEDCKLLSNEKNAKAQPGWVTAQGRQSDDDEYSGFSIFNSYVGGTGKVYLGRPSGNYASVYFISSYMDEAVVPAGWDVGNYNPDDETVVYAEYNNRGPGSNMTSRVNWLTELTEKEAWRFSDVNFVGGMTWIF